MFIRKDLRKIPAILADAQSTDENAPPRSNLRDLRLPRRKAEFAGSVKILCQPAHATALEQLESLSLYECEIANIEGMGGMLPSLTCLSLGRNPLSSLPADLGLLTQLKELWLDDCQLKGPLPDPILQLTSLEELRLSNNQITSLPETMADSLPNLRVLSLDRNHLTSVPDRLQDLTHLQTLLLRHNQLTELPAGVPGPQMTALRLLHVSSNLLTTLPDTLAACPQLTHVYANGNQIRTLPSNLFVSTDDTTSSLRHLNLTHNQIEQLPATWGELYGDGRVSVSSDKDDESCVVLVRGNPVWNRQYESPKKVSPSKS
jgi:leucine-rich repeat protein SHOC2